MLKLSLYDLLHYLGDDREDGNRTVVCRIVRITGLQDGVDLGMFPGCGGRGCHSWIDRSSQHAREQVRSH